MHSSLVMDQTAKKKTKNAPSSRGKIVSIFSPIFLVASSNIAKHIFTTGFDQRGKFIKTKIN